MRYLYNNRARLLVFIIGLFLAVTFVNAVSITSTATGGSWSSGSTWVGGVVPLATDIVVIATGANVSTDGNQTCAGITITGTLTLSNGNTLTVNGNVSGTGTWTAGVPTRTISLTGNWTFNGTSAGNGATVVFTGTAAQTLSGKITTGSGSLIINKSGGSVTLNSNISMTGRFTLTAGTFDARIYLLSATSGTLTAGTLKSGAATWGANYLFTPTPPAGFTIEYYNANPTINGSIIYQNLVFSGTGTAAASAALRIQGNLTNTGGGTLNFGANAVTLSGTVATNNIAGFTTTGLVSMTKTAGTATLTGNVKGGGLTINGSNGILNLGTSLTHTFTGTWKRTAGALDGGSSTINFTKSGTVISGTGGTFAPNAGTVGYTLSGAQTAAPLTYNNLTLSGSSVKTTTGITVTGILSMEGTATASFVPTYGPSATLQYKGSSTQTTGVEFPATWSGTGGVKIENANGVTLNSARSIGAQPFYIGSVIANSIFNDGGYQFTATGTLNLTSGSYIVKYTTFPAFGTTNIAPGTTVDYAATAAQTVSADEYSNLTISGTGNNNKTAGNNITVNGILNLSSLNYSATQGCLHMGSSYVLTMGASATTTGTGDITGIVTRNSFAVNTPYTFGNQFTTINLQAGGLLPSSISLKIVLTTSNLSWKDNAIHRYYDIAQTGGTSGTNATLNLHYLTGELNGTTPGNLDLFDYHVNDGLELDDHGHSNNNTSDLWVGLANLSITYIAPATTFPSKYWTLGNAILSDYTWLGAENTVWKNTANWTGAKIPTTSCNVVIPHGNGTNHDPVLPDTTAVASITIQPGGILNGGTGTTLTITGGAGAWENKNAESGFIAGTSTVVFTNAAATMSDPTNFYSVTVNSGATLTLGTDNIMRIAGALTLSGTLNAASNHNTVEYNGAGAQTVVFPNGSTTGYHNLILSGSGAKTMPSPAMTIYGDFSISGSATAATSNTLTIAGNFTLAGTASATAGNVISIRGNVTLGSGTTFIPGTGAHLVSGNWTNNGAAFNPTAGSITFNSTSASQSINGTATTQTFNDITIDKAGQTISIGGSTTSLNLNKLNLTSGILDAGTGNMINVKDWWENSGSFIPRSGTVTFNGISEQSIHGTTTFNNLTINNTSTGESSIILTSEGTTVNGVLNLQSANASATQGTLHTDAYTLNMGPSATTTGTGDVTGIVRRTSFVANTPYTFGNQFTTLNLAAGGTLPTSVSFNIFLTSSNLTWKTDAIHRYYDIAQTGGTSGTNATLNLHYLTGELNGTTPGNLDLFDYHVDSHEVDDHGHSNSNTSNQWVGLANLSITYIAPATTFPSKYWTLGTAVLLPYTWLGAQNTVWKNTANWTEAKVPTTSCNVVIPHGNVTNYDPVLPDTTAIYSITIQPGGILNGGTGTTLTITGGAGAWENKNAESGFNAGTSTVVLTNTAATISDPTNFYNLTVADGATLTMGTDNIMRIAGTLSLSSSGVLNTASNHNTVEYNGTGQNIIWPNGSTPGYHNLILSGSGTKTMPSTPMTIFGDFTLNGSASTSAAQDITISGNWSDNSSGSFNAGTGTVTFNGAAAQTITGSNTFNNLTINSAGVTANQNQEVDGVLNLQSANASDVKGSLDMSGSYKLSLGENATTTGTGDVTGIVRREHTFVAGTSYTFNHQFTTMTFAAGGTPYPTALEVKVRIGTVPAWKTGAIKRIDDYIKEGTTIGECYLTFASHYLDSELNGNDKDKLVRFKYTSGPPETVAEVGRSSYSTSDNWVANSNIQVSVKVSTGYGSERTYANSIAEVLTWNGSLNNDFSDQNNWTPNSTPGSLSNIVIEDASLTPNDPTLSAGITVNTLSIENAGILNSGNKTLTIAGTAAAWINQGTFNAGIGTVIFSGTGVADIGGTTDFNNITISSGTRLSPGILSYIGIAGIISNSGTLDAFTHENTIEFNGTDQTIPQPNGASPGYHNLILSGSGAKTMPSSLTILGDFTLSGSASATPAFPITLSGTTTISGTGNLILGATGVLSDTGPITLNGGTFSTGATGYTETVGTLALEDNSTIALGSGVHTLTFAASNGVSWTSDKILTITGWTGTFGSSGTAGKIFFGNSNSGLNSGQLAQLRFFIESTNYVASILPTGEIVPVAENTWIWNGSVNEEWSNASNWNSYSGGVPASGSDVIILTGINQPQITTAVTCANLAINSGALTVSGSGSLTVSGTIANIVGNTGLVIQSNLSADGALINNNSQVNATVELYNRVTPAAFHFFVPPVSVMNIYNPSGFNRATALAETKSSLGLINWFGDLMSYSESAAGTNQNLGWQYYDGWTGGDPGPYTSSPFSSITSSKGYDIHLRPDEKISFKGTLNATPHSFTLNRSPGCVGWNLVGNPYPCNINLAAVAALTTPANGVDKTIYFSHNNSYAVWNVETKTGTTYYSDFVPSMQGFFVHVAIPGNTLDFPADSKTTSSAPPRSKGASLAEDNPIEKVKLVLSNPKQSDETIVCLIDKATKGFDGDYDGYKLFGSSTTVPYIYTELNSVKYAINSVQGPVSESVIIPVTVELKSQGTYKIDITEFENLTGIKVVLKHGAIETNLSKNTSYSFTSAAGTFTDFQLIFGGTATGVENPLPSTEKLKTWYSNNFLYINCPADIATGIANLFIYDLQGKPVYNNTQVYLISGQTIQLPVALPKGVYFTRLTVNNQPIVSKIIVL